MFGRELKNLFIEGLLAGLVLSASYSASFAFPPDHPKSAGLSSSWPATGVSAKKAQGLPEDEHDKLSSGA